MKGERSAKSGLAGFINREYGRLVTFVRRRLDEAEGLEAEDIVQDVIVGLFDRADISAPVHNLAAYVYRALRNRVVDAWRKRRGTLSLDYSPVSGGSLAEILADDAAGAVEKLELEEMWSRFMKEMARLSPAEAEVLQATEWEGRGFRELSLEWGIPVGTLLARKSRALEKIRERVRVSDEGSQGEEK